MKLTLKKRILVFLILSAIAAVCWGNFLCSAQPVAAVMAVVFTVVAVCFFGLIIAGQLKIKKSGYFVFGFTDVIFSLIILAYALYDLNKDTGYFSGLAGTLLIVYVLPVCVAFLVLDIILYFVKGRKNRQKLI